MDKEFLKNCWLFVQQQQKHVLIVSIFGDLRAFIVKDFRGRGRDYFQNEIIGGQDITDLVTSIEMHIGNNKLSIESKVNNLPLHDFTFGHDNFMWLKMVRKNEY